MNIILEAAIPIVLLGHMTCQNLRLEVSNDLIQKLDFPDTWLKRSSELI